MPAASPPTISLPKGGGAIRDIGEKFTANAATGTGAVTVPLGLSPGRSAFSPQLELSYDSGSGNGPFGFGWQLSLPSITRKTHKGLPRYWDASESDAFLLSGAEDLVPVPGAGGLEDDPGVTAGGDAFTVRRYRPRIEGQFFRIERWTRQRDGDMHWRSYSRDNVLTLYGLDEQSRISDPADPARVFAWLITESRDDRGDAIRYAYQAEDDRGVDLRACNERNRGPRSAHRYLKRIVYGNRTPLLDPDGTRPALLSQATLAATRWHFHVVLDYDEGHYEPLPLDPAQPEADQQRYVRASDVGPDPWTVRPDPFSTYRSTFEVRTYRRCHRMLLWHAFDELGLDPTLVRSIELGYADLGDGAQPSVDEELTHEGSTGLGSFITRITNSGYVRDDTRPAVERGGARYATYLKRSFPPLEFRYSKARLRDEVQQLDAVSMENLPAGLDATRRFVDLDGEGLAGVLASEAGAWYYKPNLGGGRLGALRPVDEQPALASGRVQLLDLTGEGRLDVVDLAGPLAGFHQRTIDQDWERFRPFLSLPELDWQDPHLRFADLTGDGRADALLPGEDELRWHPSLGRDGFDSEEQVAVDSDEEQGPRLVAAGEAEAVFVADMSGDGLGDVVRVRAEEICYWPNLGYGHFGAKVTMDGAPLLDAADEFDPHRVRLADIDGSGTSDLCYLGRDGVRLYFNLSGNRWSAARRLAFPAIDDFSAVQMIDLFGNGTACLVWSSPLPGVNPPLRYVDLMGGGAPGDESGKPHLLVQMRNNLGAQTRISYASSTAFYVADKAAGRPWTTRLPFPVLVVERVETDDLVSRNRFVTRYAYHDGFFDGEEREFRGFGMVEQWDTQELAALTDSDELPPANMDPAAHVPPVRTKTWFHTGVYLASDRVSTGASADYYREPGLTDAEAQAQLLADTRLPPGLTPEEEREACRALKGATLREEVYADDGSPRQAHPYSVVEHAHAVVALRRRGANRHAVFFVHQSEAVTFHYERDPTDPRVAHHITLEIDDDGNVRKEAEIGYARRHPDATLRREDREVQARVPIVYSEYDYTNAIDIADAYRTRLPCETRTYELTGCATKRKRVELSDTRPAGAVRRAAARILAMRTSMHGGQPQTWPQSERLLPHAFALSAAPLPQVKPTSSSSLCSTAHRSSCSPDQGPRAVDTATKASQCAQRRLGAEHPGTLNARGLLVEGASASSSS